jgi:hypothetical protein
VGLGVITDLGHPWLSAGATLAFGAIHSAVAPRVVDGRHRTDRLSVRSDVAGRHIGRTVILAVASLAGVTIAAALAAGADGAEHPVTIASVLVAAIILLGGPRLLGFLRRQAAQAGT